jgi:hypothetical protein
MMNFNKTYWSNGTMAIYVTTSNWDNELFKLICVGWENTTNKCELFRFRSGLQELIIKQMLVLSTQEDFDNHYLAFEMKKHLS